MAFSNINRESIEGLKGNGHVSTQDSHCSVVGVRAVTCKDCCVFRENFLCIITQYTYVVHAERMQLNYRADRAKTGVKSLVSFGFATENSSARVFSRAFDIRWCVSGKNGDVAGSVSRWSIAIKSI